MKNRVRKPGRQTPTHDQIAARAHQLYLERGAVPGHEIDDWLQAEYDLMQLPIRKIAELPDPAPARTNRRRKSLVHLVHAAMVMGSVEVAQWLQ